ncbi:MAG: SpoIIE family protein phosphatase [Planctomycetota bacterium]|jgi:serine phosphatase RsbU (regulator of sigma subunit)|nr:SpoIIE family protein phosphatase [Planctomycetota bacterium]
MSQPLSEQQIEYLSEISTLLNSIDCEELLDLSIQRIPEIIQARLVSIYICSNDNHSLILTRHNHHKNITDSISLDGQEQLVLEAMRTKGPILVQDVKNYRESRGIINLTQQDKYSSSSCMLIPITVNLPTHDKEVLGVLNAADRLDYQPFDQNDLQFASRIGDILGASLHNTRLIEQKLGERQQKLAHELHEVKIALKRQKDIDKGLEEARKKVDQILPDIPRIDHYSISCCYDPMESVGGDFYDFPQLKEHQIGIVIGDVSGHGVEAALVMSMTKQVLGIYHKIVRNMREAMSRANDELYTALQGTSFISAFFGILDTRTHCLKYVRAGHNPPILYNPQRKPPILHLDAPGMVLGMARRTTFLRKLEEAAIQLQPGDRLLLYTDGVVEAINPEGDEFTYQRLIESILRHADKDIDSLCQNIRKDVTRFVAGSMQSDDLTIMGIDVGNITPIDLNEYEEIFGDSTALLPVPEEEEGRSDPSDQTETYLMGGFRQTELLEVDEDTAPIHEDGAAPNSAEWFQLELEKSIFKQKVQDKKLTDLAQERLEMQSSIETLTEEVNRLREKLNRPTSKIIPVGPTLRNYLETAPISLEPSLLDLIETENYEEALSDLETKIELNRELGDAEAIHLHACQLLFIGNAILLFLSISKLGKK